MPLALRVGNYSAGQGVCRPFGATLSQRIHPCRVVRTGRGPLSGALVRRRRTPTDRPIAEHPVTTEMLATDHRPRPTDRPGFHGPDDFNQERRDVFACCERQEKERRKGQPARPTHPGLDPRRPTADAPSESPDRPTHPGLDPRPPEAPTPIGGARPTDPPGRSRRTISCKSTSHPPEGHHMFS